MSVESWMSAEKQARELIAQASGGTGSHHMHFANLAEKAVRLVEAMAAITTPTNTPTEGDERTAG